jgi:4-methylaminobutanoate oxidase (formaldehyde-forming)
VTDDYLTSGTYELEVATVRVPAKLHMGPLYDPSMSRIKA